MKVVGVGLNKTGTKTLRYYLRHWGFRHKTYDLEAFNACRERRFDDLFAVMADYDSFEDWPWPLMYREIDEHFPDTRFVLTMRSDPEIWYRSLCNMAVRMGPLKDFEQHIYGYAMPQGHREEHLRFYHAHNQEVERNFAGRPGKLLKLCWESGDDAQRLADFLGLDVSIPPPQHVNRSSRAVYAGDNLLVAQANRLLFQTWWYSRLGVKKGLKALRYRLG